MLNWKFYNQPSKVLKFFTLVFSLFVCIAIPSYALVANAQNKKQTNKIIYGVFYEYKHVYNLDKPKDTLVDQTLLLLSESASRFMSYQKLQFGVNAQKQFDSEMQMQKEGEPFFFRLPLSPRCFVPEHFIYFQQSKHYVMDFLGHIYLYENDFPKPKWQLINESKTILGLPVKRAVTTYKGRKWNVWYTERIPLSSGPWELIGLPGLVVEARDDKGEVSFQVKSISPFKELADDEVLSYFTKGEIELPVQSVKRVKKDEFNKVVALSINDRQAFIANPQFSYAVNMPMYLQAFIGLWTRNRYSNPISKE